MSFNEHIRRLCYQLFC